MVYELRPGNGLAEDIRRLGCAQIGQTLTHLSGFPARQKGVHEARKCLKRARSLLHIASSELDRETARKLDRRTARVAGSLSGTRDCQAMIEALDALEEHFGRDWSPAVCGGLRAMFQGRLQRGVTLPPGAGEKTVKRLKKLHASFETLKLNKNAGPGAGLELTYANAQRRFRKAYELGEGAAFHEWRKEAQRHWRQMQLMVAAWPEAMTVRIDRARALSQCLGDDHDLYVLLGHVRAAGPELAPWPELERFYDGCIERQLSMRMAAQNHGKLLFAEKPEAFRRRIMKYWRAAAHRYTQGMPVSDTPRIAETIVRFPATANAGQPSAGDGEAPGAAE